jgi:hypothetical protein
MRNEEQNRYRSRPKRRTTRTNRRRYRIALLAAALLAALLFAGASFPLQLRRLPDGVAQMLEKDYGLRIEFEDAHLWFVLPRMRLTQARLLDVTGEVPVPLASAQTLEASVNPLAWLLGWGRPLHTLKVDRPSPLEIEMVQGRAQWPENVRKLIDRFASRATAAGNREWPLARLEISHFSAAAVERMGGETALPLRRAGQSYETTAAALRVSVLQVRELTGQRFSLRCAGEVTVREAPSPFELHGTLLGLNEFAGDLVSPSFRGFWPMGFRGSAAAEARDLRLDLRLLRRNDALECFADATASALALSMPQHSVAYQDENLRASVRGTVKLTSASCEVDRLELQSPNVALEASGSLTWARQWCYAATVNASHIGAPYIELLNTPLPHGFQLTASEGAVAANLHVAGGWQKIDRLVGSLTFSTVTLQMPHFRRPLEELQGELDFEPRRVVIHDLSGRLGAAWLKLDGALTGDYLTSQTGTLAVRWQSRSGAREIAELVRAAAKNSGALEKPPSLVQGAIESEGELEQPVQGDPEQWPAPRVSGKVVVRDVALAHPALPLPITGASGEFAIRDARVTIDNFQAMLGDNRVTVQGALEGHRYFWEDPVLSATASVMLDAATLATSMEPPWRARIAAMKPAGEIAVGLRLEGALNPPGSLNVTGNLSIHNGSVDVVSDYFRALVTNLDATAEWNGKALTLTSYRGVLGGVEMSGQGTIDPAKVRLHVVAAGALEQVQKMLPRMEPYMAMRGPARCDVTLDVNEPLQAGDAPRDMHPLVRLVGGLPARLARAMENGTIARAGTIVAGNATQGASFRHNAMPPARTLSYGISVPDAQIGDIHGTIAVKGNTLEVSQNSPALCSAADTPNCRLWGKVEFVPHDYPRVTFTVETNEEARFDTWLTGWGTAFRPPAKSGRAPMGRRFELDGTIRAARATYKGESVGESSGRVLYTFVRDEPPRRTEFRDVVINGFGGTMRGSGVIESWRDDPDNYPRWQTEVQLDHVRIPPLSRWVFRDPTPIEGALTGRIRLEGVKTDVRRLRGQGRASLAQVEIGRLPFILKLFQVLNLTQTRGLFEKAAYTSKQPARFTIADGVLTTEKIDLETEGLLLELTGKYSLEDHRVDMRVRLDLFESSLLGALPFVGDIARLADRTVGKAIVAFRVEGPAAQPTIVPIPLPMFQNALPRLPAE